MQLVYFLFDIWEKHYLVTEIIGNQIFQFVDAAFCGYGYYTTEQNVEYIFNSKELISHGNFYTKKRDVSD